MARKKNNKKEGFIGCSCKTIKTSTEAALPDFSGNDCTCNLISKFKPKIKGFSFTKLRGITSIVVNKE